MDGTREPKEHTGAEGLSWSVGASHSRRRTSSQTASSSSASWPWEASSPLRHQQPPAPAPAPTPGSSSSSSFCALCEPWAQPRRSAERPVGETKVYLVSMHVLLDAAGCVRSPATAPRPAARSACQAPRCRPPCASPPPRCASLRTRPDMSCRRRCPGGCAAAHARRHARAQPQATQVVVARAEGGCGRAERRTDLSRAWLVVLRCSVSEILRASLIFLSVCGGGQSRRRARGGNESGEGTPAGAPL